LAEITFKFKSVPYIILKNSKLTSN
jgi:hypothetical protein